MPHAWWGIRKYFVLVSGFLYLLGQPLVHFFQPFNACFVLSGLLYHFNHVLTTFLTTQRIYISCEDMITFRLSSLYQCAQQNVSKTFLKIINCNSEQFIMYTIQSQQRHSIEQHNLSKLIYFVQHQAREARHICPPFSHVYVSLIQRNLKTDYFYQRKSKNDDFYHAI